MEAFGRHLEKPDASGFSFARSGHHPSNKSRFAEMFKRAECLLMPLEDCVESIDSGKSPACQSVSREGSMPGVLKLSALSSGRYLEEENKALLPDEVILPAKEVMTGDILMTRKNTPELVGKSVLVKKTAGNVMFPDLVFRMHPADGMDGTYLAGALSGPLFNSIREMAHGSAKSMSNIPKGELRKLPVPVPPLSLQQEFAAFAEQADKSAFVANRQGLLLDALTRAIAVRGYTQGESENHGPTCVYSLMEMRI